MLSQNGQLDSRESGRVSRRTALAGIGGGAAMAAALSMLRMTPGVSAQSGDGTPESGGSGNYIVIRQYQLMDGVDAAEIMQQIQDGFVPIIRDVPGFVAYYYLHEPETGATASISIFADKAGSEESTLQAAGWIEEHFEGIYEGPPEVMAGTLGISEVAS